jgi:hypothetical protein
MANRVHDFGHRAPRPVESRAGRRPTPLDRDHPLFEIQRSAGNRAVSELVSNPSRSPGLLRALLLRDGPAAGPTPGGVQDVPIGQPAPTTISPAELAAGVPAPPNTVTYGGGGSSAAPSTAAPASTPTPAGGTPAPAPDPSATTAGPATSPATTTATAPPTDDSHAHLDPTLTVDPFNVTLTLTVADLHAWRSSHHLADVDFLADPSVAISVGTDPGHAVAGQAAVNLMLVHIKQNGESVLDLGFGPSVSVDGSGASVGGQATAEYHVTDRASITFTATATPVPNGSGGLDVNSSAIVGAAFHFP